ncbi:DUF1302 domain-containing protein [Aromatoleum petrolei]|uniref:DUF1302 family protein n=1 Tax=Aromatoleum petrolei TaxID=76116 RepID=A0ABX1MPW0_9RHOO|nr:DUF1302 domain-containing protein [Aromatoleum petrolei]NMF87177.1 DUF1302 family protein [Aromatoleum petrolei]QTQ34914.1 putative protein DUF1302 [Aromatoleum petrolei]
MKSRTAFVLKPCVATAIAMAFSSGANALDFEFADGWKGNWSSSLSLGTSIRARNPDSALYGQGNGALVGRTDGTGNNTIDEGNLNYKRGDAFSTQLKLLTEVEIKKGTMGAFVRGKAWHDFTLNDQNVHLGNQPNGYNGYDFATNRITKKKPLSDDGFERLNKFSGVYLLDAYAYDSFDIAGNPLQLRVGNQVINWGESLFIQGVNQINPIDVPSFRKPGVQVKEVFLPVPIVQANQTLGDIGSVEVFYQWKWRNTPIEAGCGNYWGVAGGSIGASPNNCFNAVSIAGSSPFGLNSGFFVNTVEGNEPSDSGQFGVAFRTYADALDAEIGAYAMKIHSRTPVISLQFGDFSSRGSAVPFASKWEYPEDIKIYGLSYATNVKGWSVGAEVSHSRDVPAQIDGNDLLLSGLGATGFIVPGTPVPFGPYGQSALAAQAGNGYLVGYTRTNKTQLQLNTIKVGNGILGAEQYLFVGEVGFQWNDLDGSLRYNRPFIFGPGPAASYGAPCAALNISKEGCGDDGYVTDFAWGYRLKMELTYNNIYNSGITFQPSVFWSHDVDGWSVDSQFSEGRQVLGLGARFSYAKKYNLELNAVRYNRDAKFDPLRDRDFYSATVSMSF